MNRWTRPVNVMVLALFVMATASGVLAFAVGSEPASEVVVAVHGASGLGLLLLLPAKTRIAQRGLKRAGRSRTVIGLALAALTFVVVGSGVLHAISGFRPVVGLLPMQIHVGSVVGAAVLLVVHVARHRRWGVAAAHRRFAAGRVAGCARRRRRCGPVVGGAGSGAALDRLVRGRLGGPRRDAGDAVAVRPRAANPGDAAAPAAARPPAGRHERGSPAAAHRPGAARLHRRLVCRAGVGRGARSPLWGCRPARPSTSCPPSATAAGCR